MSIWTGCRYNIQPKIEKMKRNSFGKKKEKIELRYRHLLFNVETSGYCSNRMTEVIAGFVSPTFCCFLSRPLKIIVGLFFPSSLLVVETTKGFEFPDSHRRSCLVVDKLSKQPFCCRVIQNFYRKMLCVT